MTVTFSAAAKAEVCRAFPQKYCCALAECFGILLFCNNFTADNIRIITDSFYVNPYSHRCCSHRDLRRP